MIPLRGSQLFRDYVVDGVPSTKKFFPQKHEIREWAEDIIEDALVPDMYGADRTGVTAADTAFADLLAEAKSEKRAIRFNRSARYRLASAASLWIGNDNASEGIPAIFGTGAEIISEVNNDPVVDFFGIENGQRFMAVGLSVASTANTPTCAFALGRPKQAASVVSSGQGLFIGCRAIGTYSVGCVRNVQSESNEWWGCEFIQQGSTGHAVALTRHDYFSSTFYFTWDNQSAAFAPGEDITTVGGFAATILGRVTDYTAGKFGAWIHVTAGTIADNEQITGESAQTADADLPSGYDLIGAASPNTALGVEDDSTCSLQGIQSSMVNISSAGNPDPSMFISDWTDVTIQRNNFNHSASAALGYHVHVQEDQTRDPTKSAGISGFVFTQNFFHSRHLQSVTFGDVANGGGTYGPITVRDNTSAGATADVSHRFAYVGPASPVGNLYDSQVDVDFGIDLRNCNAQGANFFAVRDVNYGRFDADLLIEGLLHMSSDRAAQRSITTADASNRLTTFWMDLGMWDHRKRNSATIASGAITVNQPMTNVISETGTSDLLTAVNFPTGVELHGQVIWLKAQTGHTIDVVVGSVIKTRQTQSIRLSPTTYSGFIKEETSGFLIYVGDFAPGVAAARGFTQMTGTGLKGTFATYSAPTFTDPAYTAPTLSGGSFTGQVISATPTQTEVQNIDDEVALLSGNVSDLQAAVDALATVDGWHGQVQALADAHEDTSQRQYSHEDAMFDTGLISG